MMIMKTSRLLRWGALIMVMMIAKIEINAQNEVAMPGGLYQFGKNSSNVVTANENIDSVTVGGVLQYWAKPDPSVLNPANTYAWTLTPALGSQTAGSPTDLATMTFTGTGTGNITVTETSSNGCVGTVVSIPVTVIPAPTISDVTFSAISCPATGTTPPYTVAGPIATLTISSEVNGEKRITVVYNITGPGGSFVNIVGAIANVGNGTTIDLTGVNLPDPGTYTMEIVSVTDRVSQKSGVTTTLNANYTFTVNRTPITGPIFHVPNY